MRGFISHLRYTVRLLLKSPGFTVPAILILALGIGANTAIFSLVDGVLLKPLPYPRPDRLVSIYQTVPGFDKFLFDYPDYLDFRRDQHAFIGITGFASDDFTLTGRGEAELISGVYTSGSLFQVLARPFLIGAPFSETENKSETRAVVVISEHLWKTKFQRDPKAVGATLSLDGRSFEIIGVTSAQANEWGKIDVYVPITLSPSFKQLEVNRGGHPIQVIGRLKDEVTMTQARSDLETINQRQSALYPATNKAVGVRLVPYLESVVGDYSASLWLLEAAVGCLLLITCANVANLMITRVQERRRDVTIRAALGATRTRLFVQLFLESAALALVGGFLGLVIADLGINLIRVFCPEDISRFQEIDLGWGAAFFVLAVTGCTAILSGVLPALAGSKADLTPVLAEGSERGRTAGPLRQKKQAFLVAGQVALTFVLLTAAGLLARSYQALQQIPLGFNAHQLVTGDIYLTGDRYADSARTQVFFKTLLEKLRQLPGITGAALNDDLPFKGGGPVLFGIAGEPDPEPGQEPAAEQQTISPDYFSVLGIQLLRGRSFNDQDEAGKQSVVIVSESLVQHFFPGQDPIGKQLHDFADKAGQKRTYYTIVGVVPDVEHDNPETAHASFQAYYPYAQAPYPVNFGTLVVSAEYSPQAIVEAVRKTIGALDPNLPFSNVATFDEVIGKAFATRRLSMWVVGLFSGTALLLATIGLYAVLSYSVIQRKREIGVRIALGAQARNILRLVVAQGLRIGAIGLSIGIAGAVILSRFIEGLLYQIPGTDPLAFLTAAAVLCLAALAACLLPALRATRVNPITALRE